VRRVICKIDSRLRVGHLNNEYQIKDPMLLQYYHQVQDIMDTDFDEILIQHVRRGDNARADALSKLA